MSKVSESVMSCLSELYCSGVECGIKLVIKRYNMEISDLEIEKYVREVVASEAVTREGVSKAKAKKSKAKKASPPDAAAAAEAPVVSLAPLMDAAEAVEVPSDAAAALAAPVVSLAPLVDAPDAVAAPVVSLAPLVDAPDAVAAPVVSLAPLVDAPDAVAAPVVSLAPLVEATVSEKVSEKVSISIPIPFNKKQINANGCHGLAYNHGLFTQCEKKVLQLSDVVSLYCKTCDKEIKKGGFLSNGTIEERCCTGEMDYIDRKGRKPISYLKVLEKQNISIEQAKSIASELNIEIEESHFVSQEQKRGRPKIKGAKQVEAAAVEDLFAALIDEMDENDENNEMLGSQEDTIVMSASPIEEPVKVKVTNVNVNILKEEQSREKEERNNMKQEETYKRKYDTAAEKESKLQQAAAAKAEKEAKLVAEKAAKLQQMAAEKEAKLAAAKAEKESKLQAAAAEKEAKLQAAAAAKAEKEAKEAKEAKGKGKKEKKSEPVAAVAVAAVEVAEEPVKVSVKRITIEGKEYFRTAANILYDPVTKEEVGLYDEKTHSIKELPEESDDEIEEDEYVE